MLPCLEGGFQSLLQCCIRCCSCSCFCAPWLPELWIPHFCRCAHSIAPLCKAISKSALVLVLWSRYCTAMGPSCWSIMMWQMPPVPSSSSLWSRCSCVFQPICGLWHYPSPSIWQGHPKMRVEDAAHRTFDFEYHSGNRTLENNSITKSLKPSPNVDIMIPNHSAFSPALSDSVFVATWTKLPAKNNICDNPNPKTPQK